MDSVFSQQPVVVSFKFVCSSFCCLCALLLCLVVAKLCLRVCTVRGVGASGWQNTKELFMKR